MRKVLIPLTLALAIPAALFAQADTAARGIVSGTVYDSIARAPLSGAIIQMVLASDLQKLRTATSDEKGRYEISGVEPGHYLIGFQHRRLDSLALEMPTRIVDVRAGERSKADLGLPSPATVVTAVCRASGMADSTGLLIGMFRDATRQMPFDSAGVKAIWQEMVIGKGRFTSSMREATAPVSKDGWFALCGIPAGVDVAVRAWHGADSTGVIAANVPIGGFARHDLFLGGTAKVRGVVRSEKNLPIRNARVGIVGRERIAVTDSAGAFSIGEVIAGSQTIEVRALGFAPELRPLTLLAGSDTTLAIGLTSVKRVLDTIQVVGQRVYNRDSNGFERRRRSGTGYYFDQQTVQREHAIDITHLLWRVPSLRQVTQGFNRTISMRGGTWGTCTPSLFVDGVRMPSDMLGELDLLVRPEELEGMEVYRSSNTPAQFSDFSGCGSIVVWTRMPTQKPK